MWQKITGFLACLKRFFVSMWVIPCTTSPLEIPAMIFSVQWSHTFTRPRGWVPFVLSKDRGVFGKGGFFVSNSKHRHHPPCGWERMFLFWWWVVFIVHKQFVSQQMFLPLTAFFRRCYMDRVSVVLPMAMESRQFFKGSISSFMVHVW